MFPSPSPRSGHTTSKLPNAATKICPSKIADLPTNRDDRFWRFLKPCTLPKGATHLTPLLLPYIFNIIVLVPIGLLTLLGGERGGRLASQGKFPESEGFRTILGSLWTAILLGSVMGLLYPVTMSPLLLIQVIYKTLWLVVFVIPKLLRAHSREVPLGISLTFLVIVASYPLVIPWGQLFGS